MSWRRSARKPACPPTAQAQSPGAQQRTARISPDRTSVGIVAIALVIIIMSASYVFSFAAIAEAAAWSGSSPSLRMIAPIFIDGPILAYTITYTVFRYRREPSRRSIVVLYVFTLISTVVNVAHSLIFNDVDMVRWETWVGALIAAAAPLGALLASEEVIRLALAPPKLSNGAVVQPAEEAIPETTGTPVDADTPDSAAAEEPHAAPPVTEPATARTEAHPSEHLAGSAPSAEDAPFDPDYDQVPEDPAAGGADLWGVASCDEITELDLVLLEDGRVSA